MKKIPLTRGYFAIVDDEDYDSLIHINWQVLIDKGCPHLKYASAVFPRPGKPRQRRYAMHRYILGITDSRLVDHINGDGLDNRRANLRIADNSQNTVNSRRKRISSTGYPGVSVEGKRFRAKMTFRGQFISIGWFDSAAEAHNAFRAAHIGLHGEFSPYWKPHD
jgi:hypothetical protein